jgi:hypothetical protein
MQCAMPSDEEHQAQGPEKQLSKGTGVASSDHRPECCHFQPLPLQAGLTVSRAPVYSLMMWVPIEKIFCLYGVLRTEKGVK